MSGIWYVERVLDFDSRDWGPIQGFCATRYNTSHVFSRRGELLFIDRHVEIRNGIMKSIDFTLTVCSTTIKVNEEFVTLYGIGYGSYVYEHFFALLYFAILSMSSLISLSTDWFIGPAGTHDAH
jgi:hypothetical protein